jgi:hypothetical protein
MNDLMLDVLSLKRSGQKKLSTEENELFYTACYDLDRFRDVTLENRLWKCAAVQKELAEAIQEDDVALLRFAIEWIKGAVFGHGS